MIDLTPLEVRKKKGDFRRAMRGYDPVLVDDFLDLVADRLEELVRENMTLHDRVTRHEQQVGDYRDREKALTEALVSAQEMREEVRRQATREAELAKQAAEQQAAQLRQNVEEEVRRLRSDAQQEASQMRASVQNQREREEELLRHLHARREEFFTTYRSLLERELGELSVLARTMNVPVSSGATEAAAERPTSRAAAPAFDQPAAPKQKPEAGAGVSKAAAAGGAAAAGSAARDRAQSAPLPLEAAPQPEVDDLTGEILTEEDIDDEAMLAAGDTPPELELDEEPFAPEPFQPEGYDADALEGDDVASAYDEESTTPAGATDATEVSGQGSEARLYDGIAADESGDDIPGPIGLGEPETPAPWETGWAATGDAAGDLYDLPDEEDDPETTALLRNAAKAGYRLSDEDLPEELLLDETVQEEGRSEEDDGGWLPTLLDDDK